MAFVLIDYPTIINEYSEGAYKECLKSLYPLCGFNYIKEEDVRRCDLEEKLSSVFESGHETLARYCDVVERYLNSCFQYEKGSFAEQYKNRAFSLTKALRDSKNKNPLLTLENLFTVFICLERADADNEFSSKKPLSSVRFGVYDDDIELVSAMQKHSFKYGFLSMGRQNDGDKDFFFRYNVLMYCRMMDAQGKYTEGGNNA